MVFFKLGSHIVKSASEPIFITPFLGYIPYIFAGLVEVNSTNLSREILFFDTPSENRIGSLVSTPGIPFGTHLKEVLAPGLSFPLESLNLKGEWSEENNSKVPSIIG